MFVGIIILPILAFIMIFMSFKIDEDNVPFKLLFFFVGFILSLHSVTMLKALSMDFSFYSLINYMNLLVMISLGLTFFYYMLKYFEKTYGIMIDFANVKIKSNKKDDF